MWELLVHLPQEGRRNLITAGVPAHESQGLRVGGMQVSWGQALDPDMLY